MCPDDELVHIEWTSELSDHHIEYIGHHWASNDRFYDIIPESNGPRERFHASIALSILDVVI